MVSISGLDPFPLSQFFCELLVYQILLAHSMKNYLEEREVSWFLTKYIGKKYKTFCNDFYRQLFDKENTLTSYKLGKSM